MNKAIKTMFQNAESDIRKQFPGFNANNIMGMNIDVFHKKPMHQKANSGNFTSSHTHYPNWRRTFTSRKSSYK